LPGTRTVVFPVVLLRLFLCTKVLSQLLDAARPTTRGVFGQKDRPDCEFRNSFCQLFLRLFVLTGPASHHQDTYHPHAIYASPTTILSKCLRQALVVWSETHRGSWCAPQEQEPPTTLAVSMLVPQGVRWARGTACRGVAARLTSKNLSFSLSVLAIG